MDFYAVLGLGRDAHADAIASAYRRSALASNPECNQNHPDPIALNRRFKQVSQAYTVLSDPLVRAVFDQYGEDGVRHGGTGNIGVPGGVDIDAIDPYATFRRFFGVDSPFQVLGDINGVQNNQHRFFSLDAAKDKNPPKCDPVNVALEVSIEDVFHGSVRRIDWATTHSSTRNEELGSGAGNFEVAIPKGIADGDKITLLGKGSTKEGCSQGDVIVTIRLAKHAIYRREGNNLVVTAPITLVEALCGAKVAVKTIEGREVPLQIDEIVSPGWRRVIPGEGLPVHKGAANARGDLIVECPTTFPRYLTTEQKAEVKRILESDPNAQPEPAAK